MFDVSPGYPRSGSSSDPPLLCSSLEVFSLNVRFPFHPARGAGGGVPPRSCSSWVLLSSSMPVQGILSPLVVLCLLLSVTCPFFVLLTSSSLYACWYFPLLAHQGPWSAAGRLRQGQSFKEWMAQWAWPFWVSGTLSGKLWFPGDWISSADIFLGKREETHCLLPHSIFCLFASFFLF